MGLAQPPALFRSPFPLILCSEGWFIIGHNALLHLCSALPVAAAPSAHGAVLRRDVFSSFSPLFWGQRGAGAQLPPDPVLPAAPSSWATCGTSPTATSTAMPKPCCGPGWGLLAPGFPSSATWLRPAVPPASSTSSGPPLWPMASPWPCGDVEGLRPPLHIWSRGCVCLVIIYFNCCVLIVRGK